jgi:phytoene desaturase
MKVSIIGAGLGGLSAASLMASRGHEVTVFEKNKQPGGKINQIESGGFRFDTGPSLLTMPAVLKKLFEACDSRLGDYLSLKPVHPICRYFYQDGTIFNCCSEPDKTLQEINRIAPEDAGNYRSFLAYAESLYNRTKDAFLFNPLYEMRDVSSLALADIFRIDALRTVASRVDTQFESPYLRQFFKRFTTYNGSSPFQAPATLNVIPHVELGLGGFYIEGGIYKLVQALMQLAEKLEVNFHFNTEVESIIVENGRAAGIHAGGESFHSDLVISNSDAHETYLKLLPDNALSLVKRKRMQAVEPSCSGMVLLLGIDKTYPQLSHHNIFFSADYEKEFDDIFQKKIMPKDPTIYIANTSQVNPAHAPAGGSNLFVLVNAPYLSDKWDWSSRGNGYTESVIDSLEKRGLSGLRNAIMYRHQITPADFYEQYLSNRGSIYGTSSNSKMAAFLRPKNKSSAIDGLYLTGGSTHPGGGIPLVILSAFHAVELIDRYE